MNGQPRLVVPEPGQRPIPEDADVRSVLANFSDAESQRVLDAVADALVGELARQAARESFGVKEPS